MQRYLLMLLLALPAISFAQDISLTSLAPGFGPVTPDHLTMVSVVNTGPQAVRGILVTTLREASGEVVAEVRTLPFTLSPGVTLSSLDVSWSRRITYGRSAASTGFARTGLLGFGSFAVCTEFLDDTGARRGQTCTERESVPALNFSLVYPLNESTVDDERPLLSWEDVGRYGVATQQLRYNLQLVEVRQGQTPAEALEKNPVLLDRRGLRSTSLLYPVAAPPLRAERTYAWRVAAVTGGRELIQSQQWQFTLRKNAAAPAPVAVSYAMLDTRLPNRHYLFTDAIHFGFDNNEGVKDLRYRIIDLEAAARPVKNLPQLTALTPGLNTLDIPVNPLGLVKDNLYRLEVYTPRGQTYYLQFRIKS